MNSSYPSRGYFISGSGTDVGKTYFGCLLARRLLAQGKRVGVYKPAASGAVLTDEQLVSFDAVQLWQSAGKPKTVAEVCPQVFQAPLAPHVAARAEGREVDEGLLTSGLRAWTYDCDLVLVEGAGGLLSPISESLYNADLALEFGYPLILVVPNRLGVINDTLQTVFTAKNYRGGLPIAGIVLNDVGLSPSDPSRTSNLEELRKRAGAPILCHLSNNATDLSPDSNLDLGLDWALTA